MQSSQFSIKLELKQKQNFNVERIYFTSKRMKQQNSIIIPIKENKPLNAK